MRNWWCGLFTLPVFFMHIFDEQVIFCKTGSFSAIGQNRGTLFFEKHDIYHRRYVYRVYVVVDLSKAKQMRTEEYGKNCSVWQQSGF